MRCPLGQYRPAPPTLHSTTPSACALVAASLDQADQVAAALDAHERAASQAGDAVVTRTAH